MPNAEITICDFKHDDFRFLDGLERYHSFLECSKGFDNYFQQFQAKQRGESENEKFSLLLFDEWASYLNTISDKKTVEAEKLKMATLLMLGRSFRCHVLISQQVFYAKQFEGARENFSCYICLGNPSSEVIGMIGFDKNSLLTARGAGAGHIMVNGEQTPFQAPMIRDIKNLDNTIYNFMKSRATLPREA